MSTVLQYIVPIKSYDGFYVAKSHTLKGGARWGRRWGISSTSI